MRRHHNLKCVLWAALLISGVAANATGAEHTPAATSLGSNARETPALADTPSTPSPPGFVRQVGLDFRSVFTTKENLLIVGVGGATAAIAYQWDDEIAFGTFNSEIHPNPALDNTFETGDIIGGGAIQVGGAFALFGAGKAFSKPGLESVGRDLVRAQIVTQTITLALKLAVGRERPEPTRSFAFPSGHSSGTFATATVLQRHYGLKAGLPSYAVAGYVALSRMNEARHYLSDVVFGAAIGIMGGYTVTLGLGEQRIGINAATISDGFAVRLTWSDAPRAQ